MAQPLHDFFDFSSYDSKIGFIKVVTLKGDRCFCFFGMINIMPAAMPFEEKTVIVKFLNCLISWFHCSLLSITSLYTILCIMSRGKYTKIHICKEKK